METLQELSNNINVICTFRMLLAFLCGGIIGMERMRRNKDAGIRTHIIVAIGAALFVIISRYGFSDIAFGNGVQVDVARIASNVVTGVGFLGAGIISMRNDTVNGLTTAAGVWVTAAIGLALGSGMYVLGIGGTVVVMFVHFIFHTRKGFGLDKYENGRIEVTFADEPGAADAFLKKLKEKDIEVHSSRILRHSDGTISYTLQVQMPRNLKAEDLLSFVKECTFVKSIGM